MKTLNSLFQGMLFEPGLENLQNLDSFFCTKIGQSELRLGISLNRLPTILISCDAGEQKQSKQKFEGLQVHQYKKCKVINDESEENYFHLIKCMDADPKIITTFLDFFEDLLRDPNNHKIEVIIERLNILSQILNLRTTQPKRTAMGLWSELYLINSNIQSDALTDAWHNNTKEKLDFELNNVAIEVKSFSSDERSHNFSYRQLANLSYEHLFIMSVQLKESGETISLRQLFNETLKMLDTTELKDKLSTVFHEYAGNMDLDEYSFSKDIADHSCKFFKASDIPSIAEEDIPAEISNLRFIVDCNKVPEQSIEDIFSLENN